MGNGDSRTYWGWMGSTKFQIRMADRRACPAMARRAFRLMGSVHETATTPSWPGSQSMADTIFPLEYTRSVKLWNSEMTFSLRLPGALSSSASVAKWSSKVSVISFCCKANSQPPCTARRNSPIAGSARCLASAAESMNRAWYCVLPFFMEPDVAWDPWATVEGTACTPLSCSMRTRSKLGEFLRAVQGGWEFALQQNEITDTLEDHFATLAEEDSAPGKRSENVISEFQSFTDLVYSKGKIVSAIDWLPGQEGVVAVSCTEPISLNA